MTSNDFIASAQERSVSELQWRRAKRILGNTPDPEGSDAVPQHGGESEAWEDLKHRLNRLAKGLEEKQAKVVQDLQDQIVQMQKEHTRISSQLASSQTKSSGRYFGFPIKDAAHYVAIHVMAMKGHEASRDMLYGEQGIYKRMQAAGMFTKQPGGFSTGDPDAGIFLTSEMLDDIRQTPGNVVDLTGSMMQITTSSPLVRVPFLMDKDQSGASVVGGITWSYDGEGDAATPTRSKFEVLELKPTEIRGSMRVTGEALEDISFLASLVRQLFERARISKLEDDVLYDGTGVGRPLGMLNAGNPALLSVTRQTAANITRTDISTMHSRAYLRNWSSYVWIGSQSIIPELDALSAATDGEPLFTFDLREPMIPMIKGRPLMFTDAAPALGTAGDLALVDPSQYYLCRRTESPFVPAYAESFEFYFSTNERLLRFIERRDGQPGWRAPLTPKSGGATQSPFIRLS